MIILPTTFDGTPFYTLQAALDNENYLLKFRFNQRSNKWRVSFYDTENNPLALGVEIVCRQSLLDRWVDPRVPKGMFFASCQGLDASPPGLLDMGIGQRVQLAYATVQDLIDLGILT